MSRILRTSAATLSLAAVLLGAGCTRGSNTGAPSAGAPSGTGLAVTDTRGNASRGPCEHPFFPLKPGYKVSYNNRFPGGTATYTVSVSAGTSNSNMNVRTEFSTGTVANQTFSCENGTIRAVQYGDVSGSGFSAQTNVQTSSVEGTYLPETIRVGSSWSQRFNISLNIQSPGMEILGGGDMSGYISEQRRVVAEENVTVPAGTFRAFKVEKSSDFNLGPGMGGAPILGTEWWVEGKGLVKTVMGTGDSAIVSEATAITIP